MRRALVAIVLLWSPVAAAQSATAQAEVLFRHGRDLMAADKLAEACSAFEESLKLEPSLSTLVNLADCREKLGQLATAWGLFLDAARRTRSATDASDRRLHQTSQNRARNLEARTSRLTIAVSPQHQLTGLEIERGGERVGEGLWNRALPIDGGTYTITARAPRTAPWSARVTIAAEREDRIVEIPDLRTLPHDDETPRAAASSSQVAPLVAGAGALALLGSALGFELSARSTHDAYLSAPASTDAERSHREALYDRANTRRYIADALAAGGIVVGATAVWLYLRGRSDEDGDRAAASVQVIPSAGGLAILGQF